jgi:hypothetical protein
MLILGRDLLQCALISAAVFALGTAFSPRVGSLLQHAAASLLALVILVNHVAFVQIGSFASSEVLATAWGWVRLHPHSLAAYCTPGAAVVLLLAAAGIALPGLLLRAGRKAGAVRSVQRRLPTLVLTLVLLGLVASPLASARFGVRYAEEFESLGRSYSHSDLSFNVPFMLYAPGSIDTTIHIPYATSHIDVCPTLLHLVGTPTDGLLMTVDTCSICGWLNCAIPSSESRGRQRRRSSPYVTTHRTNRKHTATAPARPGRSTRSL